MAPIPRPFSPGLTGAQRAIARAAERLLALRPDRAAQPDPRTRMAAALWALHAARAEAEAAGPCCERCGAGVDLDTGACGCPGRAWGLPVVEFAPLPDAGHTRAPGLAERYGDSGATYARAMGRLRAAGLRHRSGLTS